VEQTHRPIAACTRLYDKRQNHPRVYLQLFYRHSAACSHIVAATSQPSPRAVENPLRLPIKRLSFFFLGAPRTNAPRSSGTTTIRAGAFSTWQRLTVY
jgi:hypothetical protein